jgi:hypothetical protein
LIAGGAIAGILLALTQIIDGFSEKIDFSSSIGSLASSDLFGTLVFLSAAAFLYFMGRKKAS